MCAQISSVMEKSDEISVALKADLAAYWFDTECLTPKQDPILRSAGLYRICDIIRSAERVSGVLTSLSSTYKREWGAHIWTLSPRLYFRESKKLNSLPTMR